MPSPGYQFLTLASARSILASRLEDSSRVYWPSAAPDELTLAIQEAVQAWQAFTASYKQRAVFTAAPATPFYDLTSVLSPACLAYTATDQLLVEQILAQLLEPVLSATWTGTGQFVFAQISSALQQRLNRFISETGCVVTRLTQAFGAGPPVARSFLPDTVLDVTRAAWVNGAGKPTTLWRDDAFAMQAFAANVQPQDPPQAHSLFIAPPVGLDVYPPPSAPGSLDLLTVQSGPTLGITPSDLFNTPKVLGIPDFLAWGVKYGALADLLAADGPARDPERAAYCEQRYAEAVALAKINPSAMQVRVNDTPVQIGSVFGMDAYLASWQSTPGVPGSAGMAGRNLLALAPIADTGSYSVSVDVVSNIPVPVLDTDFLAIDRGSIDPVLDEAQHIASFKMGGAEFSNTLRLHKNFIGTAALQNSRLRKQAFYEPALYQPARQQFQEVARL